MHTTTFSFRAEEEFAEQTRSLAGAVGLKCSDYIRKAVSEMNHRLMAERIAMLSKELSAEHLSYNESLEDALEDGLD